MSDQNFKKFSIVSRSDLIIYLRFLIIGSYKNLKRYDLYVEQLGEEIAELDLENKPNANVDSEIYDEFNDKLQRVSSKLLNLFGDLQADSLSYYKFRKQLVKRNIDVKKDLGEFSGRLLENLKQANELRNWSLHEPESLLNAHLETIDKIWGKEEVNFYRTRFNPIEIPDFEKYEGKWLISLYIESTNNQQLYNEIYQSMLTDYQNIIGALPEIKEYKLPIRPLEIELLLPETSLLMQRKKYKR